MNGLRGRDGVGVSRVVALLLALSGLLVGCAMLVDDRPVDGRISALPPIQHPADNPTSPTKVALGTQRFLDKRLSGSGQNNCQSCRGRELGWTDAKVLSRRDNGDMNIRHTPSLCTVGHQKVWHWDGRAPTLEAAILAA
jgi:cytochrome c peroxidase